MIKEVKITKANGIKAEDCAVIAQTACNFKSNIYIIKASKKVTAKSVMSLISLSMKYNDTVYLAVSGEDENVATDAIKKLL